MHQVERRTVDRFAIIGAKVMYYTKDGISKLVNLTDISKSSIRFELKGDFKKGDELEIELILPFKEKILLKGNVVRASADDTKNHDFVTVQFAPFGSDDRYNSTYSLKLLNKLIDQCSETPLIS